MLKNIHSQLNLTYLNNDEHTHLDREKGSSDTDTIISKIQRLQNKFIRVVRRLPKYIGVKLLHDSSGLSYVKDRFLSCATRTSERISKNPLVEEPITFNSVNPVWDRFPKPLSVTRPVSL